MATPPRMATTLGISTPALGRARGVGVGEDLAVAFGAVVGAVPPVGQVQSVSAVHDAFRQKPPEQISPALQFEFVPQVPLQLLGCPGAGVGVGVTAFGVGEGVGVGNGLGIGQTQVVDVVQDGLRQTPPEQIIPPVQFEFPVHVVPQAGTGEGLGVGAEAPAIVKVAVQAAEVCGSAAGTSLGAVGETAWSRSS